jgi:hypothetical protein
LGSFVSQDRIESVNKYLAFALNPVNRIDPMGLQPERAVSHVVGPISILSTWCGNQGCDQQLSIYSDYRIWGETMFTLLVARDLDSRTILMQFFVEISQGYWWLETFAWGDKFRFDYHEVDLAYDDTAASAGTDCGYAPDADTIVITRAGLGQGPGCNAPYKTILHEWVEHVLNYATPYDKRNANAARGVGFQITPAANLVARILEERAY